MRKLIVLFMISLVLVPLSAQQVVKEELFSVNRDSVEFLNYEGPHVKFETDAQIRGIGRAVAAELSGSGRSAAYFDKYRVIHVIDAEGGVKLNADIFIIEKNASVDHIDNVRRILSGYLEGYYGYSRDDAGVIAEFVTYYNAFYRKNMEYFSKVYADQVINKLTPEKSGIATRYSEWPGNTEMLIPVSASGGGKVNIDTISNKEVIEDLRTQEDKGIDSRKDMVELKEKEIEGEQKAIEKAKKDIQQEKKAIEEEKKDTGTTEEIVKKEEAVKTREEAVRTREEKNQKRQEAVQEERDRIAEDEKQLIEEKDQSSTTPVAAAPELVPFLLVEEGEPPFMGTFVLIDKKTGRINKKSSMNTVRGREYHVLGNSLLCISGIDRPPKAVRLMTMNKKTLKIEKEGVNDIYEYSALLVSDGAIYAVTRDSGKWYAGRFDNNLNLKAKSAVEVVPYTPLIQENGNLYVELKGGEIKPLDKMSLALFTE